MFGKSMNEIMEIIGVCAAVGVLIFGAVWGLLEAMNLDLTTIFNTINPPS